MQREAAGFTLVELLVAVAIMAIIASIALPSFGNMLRRSRLTASANELVAALQTARMEAVRRNARITVCPSTTGSACAGANWARVAVLDERAAEALRDVSLAASLQATGNAAVLANASKIQFDPSGFASVGTGVRAGTVTLCMPKLPATSNAMRVNVDVSRVTVTKSAASCP